MWITNAGISVWLFMIPTAEMFKEGNLMLETLLFAFPGVLSQIFLRPLFLK